MNFVEAKPEALGNMICAQIPDSSMNARRFFVSHAPSCISSKLSKLILPRSFSPVRDTTVVPMVPNSVSPSMNHLVTPSAVRTCGTRSLNLAGALRVQWSAGSV